MTYSDDPRDLVDCDPDDPWAVLHEFVTARSRSGGLGVRTTAQGLPVAVRIEASELDKDPVLLAGDILRLCQQAAMSAGIRLRENLLAAGIDRDLVQEMQLPRPDDLARAEWRDDEEADAPASWLQR
ncbi:MULTISPECIES: hypothetical protein [unclassified Gordonia (in: high G+C Gram-positive bacteria)]|uniref:hypothetical protein n=1 Tax=unclassified Gordonia (in: high G+C Gram-positive bacteria) TaxID=2657482 RepID=UPI000990CB97|nr:MULTISPECIES: hypothetical protein [unclassified Gordonia (in: high G+C Gram-positive bacteria)]MCX2754539.1 hypothetical protein [Gordonia sp. 4N]